MTAYKERSNPFQYLMWAWGLLIIMVGIIHEIMPDFPERTSVAFVVYSFTMLFCTFIGSLKWIQEVYGPIQKKMAEKYKMIKEELE